MALHSRFAAILPGFALILPCAALILPCAVAEITALILPGVTPALILPRVVPLAVRMIDIPVAASYIAAVPPILLSSINVPVLTAPLLLGSRLSRQEKGRD
jgi:hypothetical protein